MKRAETCSCSLCNKFYTYLYHHIVVLDKYTHCNQVYYDEPYGDTTYLAPHFFYDDLYFLKKRQFTLHSFIHSLVFSPEGRAWQEPEPSHVTGMALAHCILGKFLGVVCHCFPPAFIRSHFSRQVPPSTSYIQLNILV